MVYSLVITRLRHDVWLQLGGASCDLDFVLVWECGMHVVVARNDSPGSCQASEIV